MEKNILIIGPKNKKGGVATHVSNLLGYEPLKNAEVFDPGSIKTTSEVNKSSVFKIFKSLWHLKSKTKESNYKIFINVSIYPSSFIKLLLILFSINRSKTDSIFVFFHGGRFNRRFKPIKKLSWAYKVTLKKADGFFFLSEVQKKGFIKEIGKFSASLYNNYSNSNKILKSNSQKGKINFLFVGRLVKEKGLFELINAVNLLKVNGYKNFHLTIVGEGSDVEELKNKIVANDITEFVTLRGYLEEPALNNLYRKNDWLVLPSYAEGFPYVFIEGMRAGLPIITTKSGALVRLVQKKWNGFFVETQNSQMLYERMKFVLDKKPDLEDNCYRFFNENLSKNIGEKFYKDLINN